MRTLIAAASVAILAFVGYFFWQEYRQAQTAMEAGRMRAAAERTEILAGLSPGCRVEVQDAVIATDQGNALDRLPPDLRTKLGVCIAAERLYPFEKSELQRTGLAEAFD